MLFQKLIISDITLRSNFKIMKFKNPSKRPVPLQGYLYCFRFWGHDEGPIKSWIMTTEAARLPHIEVFHRVLELPVVEKAIAKSAATYSRVKDCNQLVHWALTTAESSLSTATKQAVVPIAAPIAKKLENPIHYVNHKLCLGLNKIEEKIPLVKEEPEQVSNRSTLL